MAGKASYEESVVDEVFQPKELYPISDDSELVMNENVVSGDGDEVSFHLSSIMFVGLRR